MQNLGGKQSALLLFIKKMRVMEDNEKLLSLIYSSFNLNLESGERLLSMMEKKDILQQ